MNNIIIRNEKKDDYYKTEHMTLRAFWNMYGAGCSEHYLLHLLRQEDVFVSELSLVAVSGEQIVGAIMYSKAIVKDKDFEYDVITFGPLAVDPLYANCGIGSMLVNYSIEKAKQLGYSGIVIYGNPNYYRKFGFFETKSMGISSSNGEFFEALMALPLDNEKFNKIHGRFIESEVFEKCSDEIAIKEYTKKFPYAKPLTLNCQWLHELKLGRICEVQKNTFYINYWGEVIPAKLKGAFYNEELELPVVGDYVTFIYNSIGDSTIQEVCERTSVFKRPNQSGHAIGFVKTMQEQAMIANFDYVFIVVSLNDNFNYNRIARYVSITLQGGGIPVVILTKVDLCSNPGRYVTQVESLSDEVKVHSISALYGIGLDELQQYFVPGNTIALLGSSGVGKSTLVNAICGKEVMKTSEIREEDSKGRHTTTYRALIEVGNGVTIIDTPGMREIGMCDVKDGIDETFSDIFELVECCRFSDCHHETEPGCAVKRALEDGSLSYERFNLYKKLQKESSHSAKMKAISKARKDINRRK